MRTFSVFLSLALAVASATKESGFNKDKTMLQQKAAIVANGLVANEGIDPMMATPGPFLAFLQQLLAQLLPMLLACIPAGATQTSSTILAAAQNLKPVQRWMLRYQINKALADPGGVALLGAALDRQIRAMLSTSTEADMTAAIAEVS
jgi:hypothetical protein